MTSEIKSPSLSDPWTITPEVAIEAGRVRQKIAEVEKRVERMSPLCPVHSEPGKFVRIKGSFTRAKAVYWCSKGEHNFMV